MIQGTGHFVVPAGLSPLVYFLLTILWEFNSTPQSPDFFPLFGARDGDENALVALAIVPWEQDGYNQSNLDKRWLR